MNYLKFIGTIEAMNPEPEKIILEYAKNSWPNFCITKENLNHPTTELVTEFYKNFLFDYYEKIQCWAGPYYNLEELRTVEHLEPEEDLFLKMRQIMGMFNHRFRLCDLYEPTSVPTKNFFLLCCHLLMFTDVITDDVERIGNTVLKTKEDTNFLLNEHEELLIKTNEKATKRSDLMDYLDKNCKKLELKKSAYEQMKDLKDQKEKIYGDKKKQIELFQKEIRKGQFELDNLETREKELTEQTVTDTEYNFLKTMINNLEVEISSLGTDDIDMEDILLHENDVLLHYRDCQKRVPNTTDFASDIINRLTEIEDALKIEQINNDKLINNKYNALSLYKRQQEKRNSELSDYYENLMKQLCLLKEEKVGVQTIQFCSKNIAKLEDQMVQLKENFAKEYIKISEIYEAVKNYYKSVLLDLEE